MDFARHYLNDYCEIFQGNTKAHGVHIPANKKKKGEKAEGKSFTRREKLTKEHILKHLHGTESIGLNPLNDEGNIRFAVIDVDIYPLDPKNYLESLSSLGLPFVGFRSKSGGLHLYFFFSSAVPAIKALPEIQLIRQILGLDRATEIFPKQTRLSEGQIGNWINLPYFDYKNTDRYAYSSKAENLNLEEAISVIKASKLSLSELTLILKNAPMSEAPPCVQTLFLTKEIGKGNRNVYLFNCAVYLKACFGKDFAEKLHELNKQLPNPVPYEELDKTVIASHNKGDYTYQCNDATLSKHCDKSICMLRKYGRGAGEVSDLYFEQLIQVKSSVPYYKWSVNGAEMIFYSESELMNQNKFREMCLRYLHKIPIQLKLPAWDGVLNRALSNLKIELVDAEDDLSEDSLWVSKVLEFFSRPQAMRPSQVEDGMVWQTESSELHFKGAKLLEYLDKTNLFRHFKKTQHRNLLQQLGAQKAKLRYSDIDKSGRTWMLDLLLLHEKGLFLDIEVERFNEQDMSPLDFIGKEAF